MQVPGGLRGVAPRWVVGVTMIYTRLTPGGVVPAVHYLAQHRRLPRLRKPRGSSPLSCPGFCGMSTMISYEHQEWVSCATLQKVSGEVPACTMGHAHLLSLRVPPPHQRTPAH